MKIAFRADASTLAGTGHIMRCLTLALELQARGAECFFITRNYLDNISAAIENSSFCVHKLPAPSPVPSESNERAIANRDLTWLGCEWDDDARETIEILERLRPHWLIADNYAFDSRWEGTVRPYCKYIMAIDDLADRRHDCDLLLDQTYGRSANSYTGKVPSGSVLLCGSQYALLRAEFARLRAQRCKTNCTKSTLDRILITMGGIDGDNATGMAIAALERYKKLQNCHITVVLGSAAPHRLEVERQVNTSSLSISLLTGVSDMGGLMAKHDLCIGAAGSTAWERCCLGLPTIMVVIADNQRYLASQLERGNAAIVIDGADKIQEELPSILDELSTSPGALRSMSRAAFLITDGHGATRVADVLEAI